MLYKLTVEEYMNKEYMDKIYKEVNEYVEKYNKGRCIIHTIEDLKLDREKALRGYYQLDLDIAEKGFEHYCEFITKMESSKKEYSDVIFTEGVGISGIVKPTVEEFALYPEDDIYGEEDPVGYIVHVIIN